MQYLDSSGIGELARIYVAVVKQGGAMKVIGLTPKVEEVLKITHLSQVFQEFPDEQSACAVFRPRRNGLEISRKLMQQSYRANYPRGCFNLNARIWRRSEISAI